MTQEQLLAQFVTRAQKHLADNLASIVLYGSAARGEFDPQHSDITLLVLTHHLRSTHLIAAAPLVSWWREQRQPQPLFFTPQELATATDAFPIEFHDIRSAHKTLHGPDPIPAMAINPQIHRIQLEHELRTNLLRLRQKAILNCTDHRALLHLMVDSVTTFLLLLRHTMLLQGHTPPHPRRQLLDAAFRANLVQPLPFAQLIDLREGKLSPKTVDSVQLFEDYLTQIQSLVSAVDAL
jgi:predicted nucleotidyltransferase